MVNGEMRLFALFYISTFLTPPPTPWAIPATSEALPDTTKALSAVSKAFSAVSDALSAPKKTIPAPSDSDSEALRSSTALFEAFSVPSHVPDAFEALSTASEALSGLSDAFCTACYLCGFKALSSSFITVIIPNGAAAQSLPN